MTAWSTEHLAALRLWAWWGPSLRETRCETGEARTKAEKEREKGE